MHSRRRSPVVDLISRYQLLFVLLLLAVSMVFILSSYLLTEKLSLRGVLAFMFNELGLGIITALIVVFTYERFLHMKINFLDFDGRVELLLSERFPREMASELAKLIDDVTFSERLRQVEVKLTRCESPPHEGSRLLVADIVSSYEVWNLSEEQRSISFQFNSHNLNAPDNLTMLLRDGVYQVNDFRVTVGRRGIMDTTRQSPVSKLSYIQSVNSANARETDYSIFYAFKHAVAVPGKGTAKFTVWSRRYFPAQLGLIRYYAAYPGVGLTLRIVHPEQSFLDKLSHSFQVAPHCKCSVSPVRNDRDGGYRREFVVHGGLIPYQGISLRWR